MTILIPRTIAVHVVLAVLSLFSFICLGNELDELLREGQETNPAVLAAKWRVEQALLKHDELGEFFDPDFFAAIGKADNSRSIPASTGFTSLTDNSVDAQLGIQVPVNPGAYVSVGGVRRILQDSEGYGDLYQTLFGIRVRIPLLKDRAFKFLTLDRAIAMTEYNAAVSNLLKETQILRRDIELAYIAAYENLSAFRVTQEATKRFQGLYDEARELSRLKVVPEYQISTSKLELQIGKEDEEKARVKFELSLLALADVVGITRKIALAGDQKMLLDSAARTPKLQPVKEEDAFMARGAYLEAQNNVHYARAQYDKSMEETNDELELNFGLTAQGEHENNPFGMQEIITDRKIGGDITLVWRRSIDYRGPKARMARWTARMKELNEELRNIGLEIRTAMLSAEMNYQAALNRLDMVNQGIEAAKQNLAAEQERFRLGESTSSNVTDAQKNLTTILQRQTMATADLLRARANYMYAVGYLEPSNQQ